MVDLEELQPSTRLDLNSSTMTCTEEDTFLQVRKNSAQLKHASNNEDVKIN